MYKHLDIIRKGQMKIETKIKRENGISLHYQIRKEIEKILKKSNFSSSPLPPEEKLAEMFGVSRGTIRRVLSDLVNQGTLHRIPGKGTFVNKRILSTERVTIFSPWSLKEPEIVHNPYGDVLLRGLSSSAAEKGFTLILKDLNRGEIEFSNATKESAGIVILNLRRSQKDITERIASFSIPVVVIGANLKRNDINYVAADNYGGIKEAVEYLISIGCKRLFFLGGNPDSYDTEERVNAFKKICKENLIDYGVKILENDIDWKEGTIKIMEELYRKGNLPDAFISGGIGVSLHIYEGAEKIGKEIGKDISFVGFDDFPICKFLSPPLTVISQPIELLAKEGLKLLEERIRSNYREKKQIILPTRLIIRKSCKGRR